MDLPKLSTPHLSNSAALGPEIVAESVGLIAGSPALLISDNPETVNAGVGDSGALGEFLLHSSDSEATFRLFLWHLNRLGKRRDFGVTVENAGTIGVEVIRVVQAIETDTAGDFLSVGESVAHALLSGGGQPLIVPLSLPPRQRLLLKRFPWGRGRLLGGEMEVTLRGAPDAKGVPQNLPPLVVRTVCAPAGSDLTAVTNPLTSNQPHPYGCWPGSEVRVTATFLISGPGARGQLRLATGVADAVGNVFSAAAVVPGSLPANRTAIGNPAGFGAIFDPITIFLQNQTTNEAVVRVMLSPRGADFAGAARLPNGGVHTIPRLRAGIEAADMGTVAVPAGAAVEVTYALAVAGAASTPVALFFEVV